MEEKKPERKIAACKIGPMPRPMPQGMCDAMPTVDVTYEDGVTERLFTYFPDEISFQESEFIGLTKSEALALRHKRDVAYLQS